MMQRCLARDGSLSSQSIRTIDLFPTGVIDRDAHTHTDTSHQGCSPASPEKTQNEEFHGVKRQKQMTSRSNPHNFNTPVLAVSK